MYEKSIIEKLTNIFAYIFLCFSIFFLIKFFFEYIDSSVEEWKDVNYYFKAIQNLYSSLILGAAVFNLFAIGKILEYLRKSNLYLLKINMNIEKSSNNE